MNQRKLHELYLDPYGSFLNDVSEHLSVYNMTDKEIKQSIIDDILVVLFLHKYRSIRINELCRFIQHDSFLVNYVIFHVEELIQEGFLELIDSDTITIPAEKYQAAMDFCGCWYDGYQIPDGINVYKLSDYGKKVIERNGVDLLNNFLCLEMDANLFEENLLTQ